MLPSIYADARCIDAVIVSKVTHTDEMIGDIVHALNTTGLLANSIIVFMGDNGGPHVDKDPSPSRFDSTIIERNYPYRGQSKKIK